MEEVINKYECLLVKNVIYIHKTNNKSKLLTYFINRK